MNSILVDSSFMIALYNPRDRERKLAQNFALNNKDQLLLPEVTLPEIAHMLRNFVGQRAVLAFLEGTSAATRQCMVEQDIVRVQTIMRQYSDNNFDLVDCCIMALAERLNITQILTFDRRDFGVFRPAHTPYFELLP